MLDMLAAFLYQRSLTKEVRIYKGKKINFTKCDKEEIS